MRTGLLKLAIRRSSGWRVFKLCRYEYTAQSKEGRVWWCYGDGGGYIDKMDAAEVRSDFGIFPDRSSVG